MLLTITGSCKPKTLSIGLRLFELSYVLEKTNIIKRVMMAGDNNHIAGKYTFPTIWNKTQSWEYARYQNAVLHCFYHVTNKAVLQNVSSRTSTGTKHKKHSSQYAPTRELVYQ